jgi:uncharacterized protein (DUF1697 family)
MSGRIDALLDRSSPASRDEREDRGTSGSILAEAALEARVPALVAAALEAELGLAAPVVGPSAAELAAVAAGNPFLPEGADPATLHVAFLAAEPRAAAVATLDPDRSPPDRFRVVGRELYLCLPNGVARSRLTNDYLDRTLGTTSTIRSWRTVLALVELAGA